MTGHAETAHGGANTRTYFYIWFWLLGFTLVEVWLGYIHLALSLMLTILMGISLLKAALIIAYFMHLKFERMSLIFTLIPAVVMCICLLLVFFPDSFRIQEIGAR